MYIFQSIAVYQTYVISTLNSDILIKNKSMCKKFTKFAILTVQFSYYNKSWVCCNT